MRTFEAQLPHPLADLRNAHEQLPDEAAAVVLDHHDDRPLADREVTVGVPVMLLAEAIDEAEPSPDLVAEIVVKVPERRHRFRGRIGEARQCGAGRYDALVVAGRMRVIAIDRVAGGEAPAVRSVALVSVRVTDAVGVIDARMSHVLLPVVRIDVAQPARIDAAEGVVSKEKRSAPTRSEGQLHALEAASVYELTALDPAFVIRFRGHRITRRGSSQNVGNETLVPAAHRMVQREAVGRAPVPGQRNSAALSVPIPFRLDPKISDAVANALFL